MGEAPQTYTVRALAGDGKFLVEGSDLALGISPRRDVTVGQQLNGWLNTEGKWGPYIKIAEDRQQSGGGGGRSNPGRERSIERQVALKAAAEIAAAGRITPDAVTTLADKFDTFLAASARSGGTSSPPATPAAEPTGASQGADVGAAQSDGDFPF